MNIQAGNMEESLRHEYYSIIKTNGNIEAEIECLVRQKLNNSQDFTNLIEAQSKLNNAEKLLQNILQNLEKYDVLKDEINKQKEIASQNKYQRKQYELNKKYYK